MSLKRKLLEATIGRVMPKASVLRATEIAPAFWRIDLALRGVKAAPGDKLQVMLDDGPRTYSPFAVTPDALSILAYAHGRSPGAQWGPTAVVGDKVTVFGPRGSLPLADLGPNVVLVGDETSFGVARALHELRPTTARYVFEVTDAAAAQRVLAALELPAPALVARTPGDAHHPALEAKLRAALHDQRDATLVLTGKATTIQTLRAQLKHTPIAGVAQRVKAYWAPGKKGLD